MNISYRRSLTKFLNSKVGESEIPIFIVGTVGFLFPFFFEPLFRAILNWLGL